MTTLPVAVNHPRVWRAMASTPWAILPGELELLIEIACRRGDPEALHAKPVARLEGSEAVAGRDGVAVIPLCGPIFPRANVMTEMSGATSLQMTSLAFNAALDDPAAKAIVLLCDTPGGVTTAVQEFAAMVFAARGVKPVVAYVQGAACSAGYWIASACQTIVAAPTAILGSIGVLMVLDRDNGKTVSVVSSGAPKKRVDPESEDGRAELLRTVNDLHAVFVADVAAYRGRSVEYVEEHFGQGGVLVGASAVAAGMADALGSLESVLAELSAGRPLAGNLINAKETTMSLAQQPGSGGGMTAATPPAVPPASAAAPAAPVPQTPAVLPGPGATAGEAAGMIALAGALIGPEAAQALTEAVADAGRLGLSLSQYAAVAGRFKAAAPAAPASPPATPPVVQALVAALADPAAPGAAAPVQPKASFSDFTASQLKKKGA